LLGASNVWIKKGAWLEGEVPFCLIG